MILDDSNNRLRQWAAACSQCLGSIYDICRPFHEPECSSLHPKVRFIVAQLNISCHLTSESAFVLVSHRKIWDADILIRSVLEGTLKFVYILQGSENDRQQKCFEYWEALPDFAILARQKRVVGLLGKLPASDSSEWLPIRELLVSEEEIERVSRTANRKEQQRLARKWSFSELSTYFATHHDNKYHGLGYLGFNYGVQSHIIHQDGDGVGMRWERACRNEDRRDSVEIAHGGRVISDLCSFAFIRVHELLVACHEDPKPVKEIEKGYENLFDSIKEEQRRWQEIEFGK